MKKIFSIASALMLALGMGMTSCSNDIDEVVTEQQPEMHKLYLSATAPNSPETRSYAEGVAGKDAIKITGWKNGDVIYGYYGIAGDYPWEAESGKLAFTFNGNTHEFESESTTVTKDQIKYFLYGDFDFDRRDLGYDAMHGDEFYGNLWYKSLTIDVANNYTNIPMWGTASVKGDKLTTNMQLIDVAFLCLHNSSSASIDVIIGNYSSEYQNTNYSTNNDYVELTFNGSNNIAKFWWDFNKDKANATVTTIGAGKKEYLPIEISTSNDYTVQVFIGDNDTPFASKAQNAFVSGKIYKLNYPGQ